MRSVKFLASVVVALISISVSAGDKKETTKRTLLSQHKTVAVFKEVKDHKCLGRTTFCPDRCGHTGKKAVFEIKEYLKYEKFERWGSSFQKQFIIQLTGFREDSTNKPDLKTIELVKKLQVGDTVDLSWNHNRLETPGMSRGERQVTTLKKKVEEKKK